MSKDSKLNSKPLLFGDNIPEGIGAMEDIEKFELQNFDQSYVPGYSEQRRMNEMAVRNGHKATPMDRLYWVRTARVDGTNVDYREAVTVTRLGYRACTIDDLKERGWGMPPAAFVAPDGTIRREDVALAIVDSDRAAKNKRRQQDINAEFEGKDPRPELLPGMSPLGESKEGKGVSLNEAKQALLAK